MKSDFMVKTTKIMAEIRARTCLDDDDVEVIKDILKAALHECYDALNEYYDDGYDEGYAEGYAACHQSSLEGAVERAYYEGYALGYSAGHSEVHTLLARSIRC